jgi:hypothetical protein
MRLRGSDTSLSSLTEHPTLPKLKEIQENIDVSGEET